MATTMNYTEHNRKIAKLRGKNWRDKLRDAKYKAKEGNLTNVGKTRYKKGLTQAEMADRLGIANATYYARIERGVYSTNKDRAKKISRILNKKVKDLFQEIDKDRFQAV